jgi:hypothetical protein
MLIGADQNLGALVAEPCCRAVVSPQHQRVTRILGQKSGPRRRGANQSDPSREAFDMPAALAHAGDRLHLTLAGGKARAHRPMQFAIAAELHAGAVVPLIL